MGRDTPQPTREGQLIRLARMRSTPRLSIRAAAEKAGVSAETWGYVERGYQSQGHGKQVRTHIPPADTLAHMANALEVTPEDLEEIDRHDAAQVLRQIHRTTTGHGAGPQPARPLRMLPQWVGEHEADYRQRLHEDAVRRGLDRTGRLVDGLNVASHEDELWDLLGDQRSPEFRYEMIIHMRDRDDAVARGYAADDSELERGNGTER
jgi:transcriptional regulator with XRE-family HTH domain